MAIILAIESSCDDTSAAIIRDGQVLSNCTNVQEAHRLYGGVVPEVASRQHLIHIVPIVNAAMQEAGVDFADLSAIAFTKGPGLLGSLLVGVSFGKGLAATLGIKMIEVHHMHAHILSHFAGEQKPKFPFLCLTVSGGHTQIVLVKAYNQMEVMGTTIDDAAGEAFDKVGKMLGLPYPAGPLIDTYAAKGNAVFEFAKPMVKDYDFSFSGFKTSVLYFLQKKVKEDADFIPKNLEDLCCSVQTSIVDILMKKLKKASDDTGIHEIAIAGGVAANSGLSAALRKNALEQSWNVYIPELQYCTDNAAMIGIAGYYKYLDGIFADMNVSPDAKYAF